MGTGGATTRSPPGGFFVGRGWELGQLQGGLSEAKAGRGRLYAVSGEPGIGKTRLAGRLAELAEHDGLGVVWGRCWEAEASPSFWPWIQVFRSLALTPQWGAIRREGLPGIGLLPELGSLVTNEAEGLPHRPTEEARFRLFDAAAMAIRTVAAQRPLVIVLDDLHAADRSSLLLLEFIAQTLGEMAVLLLATYRVPEGDLNLAVSDTLTRLGRHGHRISGEPRNAAPLETVSTTEPGARGVRRLALAKLNAWRTSTCQLVLKLSQVCSSSGPTTGAAPALRITMEHRSQAAPAPGRGSRSDAGAR